MSALTKMMLIITTFGLLSFIAVIAAPSAVDQSYSNQDSLVQEHKLRLQGYYDEDGFDVDVSEEEFLAATKHANKFIAEAYGRK